MLWANILFEVEKCNFEPGEAIGSLRRVVCMRNKGGIKRSSLLEKQNENEKGLEEQILNLVGKMTRSDLYFSLIPATMF